MARDLWWAYGAVAAVLAARRPLDPPAVDAWAAGHGLAALPAGRREPVERYLRRGRLYRTVGGTVPSLAGTVAPALWAATSGLPAPWPLGLFGVRSWLAGYLAGALVAEWSWARPAGGPLRSAALVPRRLGAYLPDRVVAAQRLAAGAGLAIVLLSLSLQLGNVAVNLGAVPARTAIMGLSWGCAAAALVAWVRIWRPRPPRRAPAGAPGRPARP